MQRRIASLGLCVAIALGATLLVRAVADNFDPAEKVCAQNMKQLSVALLLYSQDYDEILPLAYERAAFNQLCYGA